MACRGIAEPDWGHVCSVVCANVLVGIAKFLALISTLLFTDAKITLSILRASTLHGISVGQNWRTRPVKCVWK